MATDFSFEVSCDAHERAWVERLLDVSHEEVAHIERELSEFIPESDVARLNAAPVGSRVVTGLHVINLLNRSLKLESVTSGQFDVTAKSKIGTPRGLSSRIAWSRAANSDGGTAERLHEDVRLGFGAIGKGYALDRVRAMLEASGITNYCLSAGGSSLILSGYQGPGVPWSFGWSYAKGPEGEEMGVPLMHRSGEPFAIGVSGLQEQAAHLLDPGHSTPVESGRLLSALVGARSAADADALSTALYVGAGDPKQWSVWGERLLGAPAVGVIDSERVPRWNGTFQRLWGGLASVGFLSSAIALSSAMSPATRAWAEESEQAVDLSEMAGGSGSAFNPYVVERSIGWVVPAVFILSMILLHLQKVRISKRKDSRYVPPRS